MDTIRETYMHSFTYNNAPGNWKEMIGSWLRTLANKIDNRTNIVVHMTSSPTISGAKKMACLRIGLKHAETMFIEEVKAETVEVIMKRVVPGLYESSEQNK